MFLSEDIIIPYLKLFFDLIKSFVCLLLIPQIPRFNISEMLYESMIVLLLLVCPLFLALISHLLKLILLPLQLPSHLSLPVLEILIIDVLKVLLPPLFHYHLLVLKQLLLLK